jgi:hypothetical protein
MGKPQQQHIQQETNFNVENPKSGEIHETKLIFVHYILVCYKKNPPR